MFAHHRKDHFANGAIRLVDRCLRQTKEQGGFSRDLFDILDESFLHAPFGPGRQVMSDIQQQFNQDIDDFLPPAPTIGSKQGEADGTGMAAHLLEVLNGDAVTVTVQGLGRHMSEQVRRQAELVDALQLRDFLEDAREAERTGIVLECVEGRLGTGQCWFLRRFCCPCLTGSFLQSRRRFFPRLCLGELDGEQRIQPGPCLQGELLHDRGAKPFVKTMQCGMHQAADAIGSRRVNPLLLAPGVQGGDEGFLLPLLRHDLLTEPLDQRLLISERGLVNIQKRADGCAMGLDRAPFPVVGNNLLRDYSQLLGQMHDDDGRDVLFLSRKASFLLEILQQACCAKQIVIGLAVADQIKFFGREDPVFGQLFVGPVSLHETSPSCFHSEHMLMPHEGGTCPDKNNDGRGSGSRDYGVPTFLPPKIPAKDSSE